MKWIARRYDTGQLVHAHLIGDRVDRFFPSNQPDLDETIPYVAPGFVDIQVNGYGGQEFSSIALTSESVTRIVEQHLEFGVTAICPTLTTQTWEVFHHSVKAIATACNASSTTGRAVWGIHLEGPHMSKEDGPRGAHPAEHCCPPDWNQLQRLQETAEGRIRLVTLSPEYEGSPHYIAKATRAGIVVAIGHTSAARDQILAAVDSGARLSTHLGNGAHRELKRHPNYIWDQLGEDRLMASLICDGHHLPPEVVRTFVRAKSLEQCILVSDVSGLAGLPPGKYGSSGCELEILADGRLVIAGQDQLLAGASDPIGVGILNVMKFAGLSLKEGVEMASHHPARLLGKTPGGFLPGDPADFTLFHVDRAPDGSARNLKIAATILAGHVVYGSIRK